MQPLAVLAVLGTAGAAAIARLLQPEGKAMLKSFVGPRNHTSDATIADAPVAVHRSCCPLGSAWSILWVTVVTVAVGFPLALRVSPPQASIQLLDTIVTGIRRINASQ